MSYIEAVFTIHTTYKLPTGLRKELIESCMINKDGSLEITTTNGVIVVLNMAFDPEINSYEDDLYKVNFVDEEGLVESIEIIQ